MLGPEANLGVARAVLYVTRPVMTSAAVLVAAACIRD